MKYLIVQLFSIIGAALAAACCLGIAIIVTALSTIGLSFLIHDAILIPVFIGFTVLTLFLLYRSGQQHHLKAMFYLGIVGSSSAILGLILLMFGVSPIAWLIYLGLLILLVSSIWNSVIGSSRDTCKMFTFFIKKCL